MKVYLSRNNTTFGNNSKPDRKLLAFTSNNVLKNVILDLGIDCDIFFEELNWYE